MKSGCATCKRFPCSPHPSEWDYANCYCPEGAVYVWDTEKVS
jgi:hypothetical protein